MPEGISWEEEVAISGNQAADEAATEALGMHPAFNKPILAAAKKSFLMAKNVCLLAAKALPEWGPGKQGGKKQFREEVLVAKSRRAHQKQLAEQQVLSKHCSHVMVDTFG